MMFLSLCSWIINLITIVILYEPFFMTIIVLKFGVEKNFFVSAFFNGNGSAGLPVYLSFDVPYLVIMKR